MPLAVRYGTSWTRYLLLCEAFECLMMKNNEDKLMIITIILLLFNYFVGYCDAKALGESISMYRAGWGGA